MANELHLNVETIATAHGLFSVDMVLDKKIGSCLQRGYYHQEDTLLLLRHFITPGSVVLDIGAHIGTLAIPLGKIAGKVIAFEPSPSTYALLAMNIEQNQSTVEARKKGLGASAGRASLEVRNSSNAGANTLAVGGGAIEVSTLDAEVRDVDFIKIDVEGMELSVFEGGRRLIEKEKPVIFCEINLFALRAHASSPRKIERFLRKLGYELYYPLLREKNGHMLGRIQNLELVAACFAPRSWLLRRQSAPFYIIALPVDKKNPLPTVSSIRTLMRLIVDNLRQKVRKFIR